MSTWTPTEPEPSEGSSRGGNGGSGGNEGGGGDGGNGDGEPENGNGGDEAPTEEFSWLRVGPKSPEFDSLNPDHVYDLIQRRNCPRARDRYETLGAERRAQNPTTWNLLNGLIAVCFAVQGEEREWETVVDSYRAVKGKSTGDCKYEAGYRMLEQIASFLLTHPEGKVLIREAPTGPGTEACPFKIEQLYVNGVPANEAGLGEMVSVSGTWPSEVQDVFLDGTKAVVIPPGEGEDYGCCHKATTNFQVPEDMQPGTVDVITLSGNGFEITASVGLLIKKPS